MPLQSHFIVISAVMLSLLGCGRSDSITTYNAPKDPPPSTAPVLAEGEDQAAPTPATGPLKWTVPAQWKELGAREMRVATFLVNENPPVELTVIPLGQEAGDLLANVNRWETQLGLPPSPKDSLDKVVKHVDVNGLHADVVDLSGAESANPRQRMLAAIVPHAGRVWFFKMTGPHDVISSQKTNFDTFINSLSPGRPGSTGGPVVASPSSMPAQAQLPTAPPSALTLKSYKAPNGWRELPNQSPPRAAAFEMGPADKKADFVITHFPQNGAGSFLDNINRWRNQLGLGPITDPKQVEMKDITIGADGPGVLVEFHNPDNAKRMLVVIASAGGELYFFKLTGPQDLVASERANLEAFMKSCEFAAP